MTEEERDKMMSNNWEMQMAVFGYGPDGLALPQKETSGWISVNDRLPENADHPGAFCPRYLVMTKHGLTEGWYNPDKGCWYTLVWFLIGRYTEDDIDMERGDIPNISSKIEVTRWMPMPEPPKE